ncbi:RNA-binding (RRM/RBD/RNP motifs) family protein [Artemisia annua]|uniref:RNA-binding (RRM/RBD/RNP motifs) family protein n=1 Tax=Artemisia annua TaxID=35608 RepID=A0A2U1NAQ4_ARTAN|nr:RNA-binding (RRM/RBD/RNP motifs) family protein [Artemisia annua]
MEELVKERGDHVSKLQEKSQVLIHLHSLQHLTILCHMLIVRGGKIGRYRKFYTIENLLQMTYGLWVIWVISFYVFDFLKLEDALASAKKLTSNRKKQLSKLHKCFLNMKEYGEKLRSSEEELQKGQTKNWLKMKCVNAGQMLLICIQMLTVS